jgi:hypothetical protein
MHPTGLAFQGIVTRLSLAHWEPVSSDGPPGRWSSGFGLGWWSTGALGTVRLHLSFNRAD